MLYQFCEQSGVPYRRTGKLIVATDEGELPQLQAIAEKARLNGVTSEEALHVLTSQQVAEREPEVRCAGALLSPATGIVDSHALMLALLGSASEHGAEFSFGSRVLGGKLLPSGRILLRTNDAELDCAEVINSAGHGAPAIARLLDGSPANIAPEQAYAKGNYFGLLGPSPFRGLVYPVPQQAGLGVHATVDLAGRCRFGPDVEWTAPSDDGALDYAVDERRADAFYAEVRKYFPALRDGSLFPDYAGVRPKVQTGPGRPASDFLLRGPAEHGVCGLVHLFGIESPGLTASLALACATLDALEGSQCASSWDAHLS